MRISLWFATAAMAAILPALPAHAAPRGSYMQSCQNIRDDGRTLSAQCRDRDGRYRPSTLRYRDCRAEISNQDGQLTCVGGRPGGGGGWGGGSGDGRPGGDWDHGRPGNGGGWNDGRPGNGWGGNVSLPGGSWARSCRNSTMRGSTLYAECKGLKRWQDTRLDVRQCRSGRAGNREGQLVCE
jgi:hypothetical protein